MPKKSSRQDNWSAAATAASDAIGSALEAIQELIDIKGEYESWNDNLPDNLRDSPVGEKLTALADLDLDSALSSVEEAQSTIQEAADADLPKGFGRD